MKLIFNAIGRGAIMSLSFVRDGTMTIFWKIIDAILPPRCIVTGDIVDAQGMVAPQVWRDLSFIGDPVCDCCGFPFPFGAETGSLCAHCLADRPVFASARAALVYDDASRGMILKFKHGDQTHAVQSFLPWLKRAGAGMLTRADVIVPVPLHRFRLLQRRYNQAALIAQALSKSCGLPYLPAGLRRTRATPTQGHLGYREREKNVRGAFIVTADVKDKTVILVDDVYTTGATVKECTQALLKAGAKEVHVLAVARVVKAE